MILIGNKCDKEEERKIKKDDGKDYAKKKQIKFFEVSAKDGTNVNDVFEMLVKDILKSYSPSENLKKRGSRMLSVPIQQQHNKKNNCCWL